ncbi:type II toxin-antitoxin system HicB family antitoxin, partial [Novosphingobium album (ex Liu et al. 2023)]
MQYFYAVVHRDPGSAYGVTFPDIPGCFSAADDLDDVVPNAVEALTLWFEDAEPVAPSSIEAIRQQAAGDLAEGAFLIAVPWIAPARTLERVHLSMDAAIVEAIDEAARRRRQTRSA